jgi:hypothetical protein
MAPDWERERQRNNYRLTGRLIYRQTDKIDMLAKRQTEKSTNGWIDTHS